MSVFTSGNWLSTAKRRAKEGILQAVGAHQATEDVEFDVKLRNFTAHVNELNKIKEAMDLWIESYDTFCLSSSILSDAFKTFFSTSPFKTIEEEFGQTVPIGSPQSTYMNTAIAFDKIMADVSQIVQPSVRENFVNRCLKPTISILSLVPAISEQVQERRTVMLDFDSYKAKIQKEHSAGRDSAHPNVVRKAQKLDDSAKKLYTIQQSIVSAIEEYEAARPIMLGAEFTSFVACMYHQSFYNAELTSKLLPVLPQTASSLAIMDSFVLQKQTVTIGENFLPSSAFSSSMFIQRLKLDKSYVPVEAVVTRSEYLGGAYGGYSTGGPLQTSRRQGGGDGTMNSVELDDEEDLRVASAHLVSSPVTRVGGGQSSLDSPLVDAVVIPFSQVAMATEAEDSDDLDDGPYRTYEGQNGAASRGGPEPGISYPTDESVDRGFFTAVEAADVSPTDSVGSGDGLVRSTSGDSVRSLNPDRSSKVCPPAKPPKSTGGKLTRASTVDSKSLSTELTAVLENRRRNSVRISASVPPPPPTSEKSTSSAGSGENEEVSPPPPEDEADDLPPPSPSVSSASLASSAVETTVAPSPPPPPPPVTSTAVRSDKHDTDAASIATTPVSDSDSS